MKKNIYVEVNFNIDLPFQMKELQLESGGTVPIPIFIPSPGPDPGPDGTQTRTGSGSGRVITVKQRDPVPIPIPVPRWYFVRIRISTHIIRRRRCRYQNPAKTFQRDGFLSTRKRSGSRREKLDPAGPYAGQSRIPKNPVCPVPWDNRDLSRKIFGTGQ
jgi:hypothetical protein